jgi:hypothetical protein
VRRLNVFFLSLSTFGLPLVPSPPLFSCDSSPASCLACSLLVIGWIDDIQLTHGHYCIYVILADRYMSRTIKNLLVRILRGLFGNELNKVNLILLSSEALYVGGCGVMVGTHAKLDSLQVEEPTRGYLVAITRGGPRPRNTAPITRLSESDSDRSSGQGVWAAAVRNQGVCRADHGSPWGDGSI